MGSSRNLSSKLFIPHPTEPNCSIVGILEQAEADRPTQGRKLALVRFLYDYMAVNFGNCYPDSMTNVLCLIDFAWSCGVRPSSTTYRRTFGLERTRQSQH